MTTPAVSQIAAALLKPNMCRKLLIFSVGLVASIALKPILTSGQLNAAQQKDAKASPAKKTDNAKKRPQSRPSISPDPSPYTGEETRNQAQRNEAVERDIAMSSASVAKDTERMANYTLALVIIGGIVGAIEIFILVYQLIYIRKSADSALSAATAALASAEHVKLTDRAFINIADWKLFPKGEDWIFQASLKNSGKTPATVIKHITCWRFTPPDLPTIPEYKLTDGSTGATNMVVAPSDKEWFFSPIGTKASIPFDIIALEKERQMFFIYGLIEYRDAFGDTHKLGFGGRYLYTRGGFNRSDIPDGYNYAD
jgi:hypothetical protein